MSGRAAPRGLTLIEMLVALVLIGVVYALSGPLLRTMTGTVGLDGAATSIRAALRAGRSYAIARRVPHAVAFELDAGTFRIEDMETDAAIGRTYRLPSGVRFKAPNGGDPFSLDDADGEPRIVFRPTGAVATGQAGPGYIWLGDMTDRFLRLTVYTATGRVKIERGD